MTGWMLKYIVPINRFRLAAILFFVYDRVCY